MANNLLKEQLELQKQIKKLIEDNGKEDAKRLSVYKDSIARLKEIRQLQKDVLTTQERASNEARIATEAGKSLSSVYSKITSGLNEQQTFYDKILSSVATRLNVDTSISKINSEQYIKVSGILAAYNEQRVLATELAQLTNEDVVARGDILSKISSINESIEEQVAGLDRRTVAASEFFKLQTNIQKSVSNQVKEATKLSKLSDSQKDIVNEQSKWLDEIKKKINAFGSTLTSYLNRPQAIVGGLIVGVGIVSDKLFSINRELGQSVATINEATMGATALSFVFDDALGTLKGITSEFGDIQKATLRVQASTNLIATNMGISASEATSLIGSFSRLNEGSTNIAADMIKTTQQFARQNNVIPADVLSDLAGSAEQFALFGAQGGDNLIKAAVGARQLGTSLQNVSGIADTLLDFESSITKELELGAMLGRNINLTRARGLAYEGDIAGAVQATLQQLGGIEEFNRMDYFQKKQTADLLGVSVAELQRMAKNQNNLVNQAELTNEKFGILGEITNAITGKFLPNGLKALGGWVSMLPNILAPLALMGVKFDKIGTSIWNGVKGLGNMIGRMLRIKAIQTTTGSGSVASKVSPTTGGGIGKAIGSAGKGLGAGMQSIAGGLASLANPATLLGLAALTGAVIGLGYALKLAAPGIKAIGEAIGSVIESIGTGIGNIVRSLGDFGMKLGSIATPEMIGNMFLLSTSITTLAGSLGLLAASSLLALPALGAISAIGTVSGVVGSALESAGIVESQSIDNKVEEQQMLAELRGLRQDLNSGKIAVYIDGERVTSRVATVSNRSTTNRGNSVFGG